MTRRLLTALLILILHAVPSSADQLLGSGYRAPSGAVYFRGSPTNLVLPLAAACPASQWVSGYSTISSQPLCAQIPFSSLSGLPSSSQLRLNADKVDSGNNSYTGSNSHAGAESFSVSPTVPTPAAGDSSTKIASTAHVAANYAGLATSNSYAGKQTLAASTAAQAPLNLPHGAAPTSPANGDCWTTSAGLYCRINGATVGPYASSVATAPTPQFIEYLSGSGTYSTPAGATRLEIEGIGGGRGGDGAGAGTAGGDTTFGPVVAPGGGSSTSAARGVAQGSFFVGGLGTTGNAATSSNANVAGSGGSGIYGGAGAGGQGGQGGMGAANSGAGGGGGGTGAVAGAQGGAGGAAGTGFKMLINGPAASYSYAVGAGGTGGASGGNTNNGGAGAAGRIRITAYFN